jgi:hypothetical protein
MTADIPITLLEAFSRGEISRKDIEDQTGEYLGFGMLLAQLHRYRLPLPRIPSDPQSVQLIKRLTERAMRRTTISFWCIILKFCTKDDAKADYGNLTP